jgi:phosphoenolpyruvate synthase/pyruvate phosphate dikinase
MSTIHWLGEDDCHHEAFVGGKAASLSRLASRHTVPHGFAISAIAATEHAIIDGLLPAIQQAYRRLGERCGTKHPPVAVRSSALDEDGATASFAGQHDTYLNIRGVDAVLDAVRRCVLSASSHEALAYRQQRGLCTDGVQMAVLVQMLVPADVSAVVFSANPITGSLDEVMINSNWGLGESIVGGMCTPDTFVVQKQGLNLSCRDIAAKDRMTVLTDAGTADVEVPPELRTAPSLTDVQVRDVARLALTLEDSVGQPVDVECAIASGTLYLLQCRPITTLG